MLPYSSRSTLCTLRRTATALLIAVAPLQVTAQTPHAFTIDTTRSDLTWSVLSSAGPLSARSPSNPTASGTLALELHATQPIQAAEFDSHSSLGLPTLRAWIPNPNPFAPAPFDLRLSAPALDFDSLVLTLQPNGDFAPDATLRFTSGTANFSFFGAPRPTIQLADVTAVNVPPFASTAQIVRLGSEFELQLPLQATFSIVEPTTLASANVTLTGTLVATALAVDELAHRYCVADGVHPNGCTPCPCGNDGSSIALGGCLNGNGTRAVLSASGSNSASLSDLSFDLTGAAPDSFALLLSGSSRGPSNPNSPCFGSGAGFVTLHSDGLRCITTDLVRHGIRSTDSLGALGPSGSAWSGSRGGGIFQQNGQLPGQTRHYQVIYRSGLGTGCGTGRNSSDALSVTAVP